MSGARRQNPALHGHWHSPDTGGSDPALAPYRTLLAVIDGFGSEIAPGVAGDATVHFHCQIARWRILADQPGDIVIDIWKANYASFPPTVTESITAAALPTLSGTDKDESTVLTDWDTDVIAGDTFRFNVDSATDVTRVVLSLHLINRKEIL